MTVLDSRVNYGEFLFFRKELPPVTNTWILIRCRLGQKSRWISQLQLSSKTSFALSRIYSPVRDLLRVKCNLKSREFVFEPSILEFLFLS